MITVLAVVDTGVIIVLIKRVRVGSGTSVMGVVRRRCGGGGGGGVMMMLG